MNKKLCFVLIITFFITILLFSFTNWNKNFYVNCDGYDEDISENYKSVKVSENEISNNDQCGLKRLKVEDFFIMERKESQTLHQNSPLDTIRLNIDNILENENIDNNIFHQKNEQPPHIDNVKVLNNILSSETYKSETNGHESYLSSINKYNAGDFSFILKKRLLEHYDLFVKKYPIFSIAPKTIILNLNPIINKVEQTSCTKLHCLLLLDIELKNENSLMNWISKYVNMNDRPNFDKLKKMINEENIKKHDSSAPFNSSQTTKNFIPYEYISKNEEMNDTYKEVYNLCIHFIKMFRSMNRVISYGDNTNSQLGIGYNSKVPLNLKKFGESLNLETEFLKSPYSNTSPLYLLFSKNSYFVKKMNMNQQFDKNMKSVYELNRIQFVDKFKLIKKLKSIVTAKFNTIMLMNDNNQNNNYKKEDYLKNKSSYLTNLIWSQYFSEKVKVISFVDLYNVYQKNEKVHNYIDVDNHNIDKIIGQKHSINNFKKHTSSSSLLNKDSKNNNGGNLNEKIIKIQTGNYNSMFMTNYGNVYAWGHILFGIATKEDEMITGSNTYIHHSNIGENIDTISSSNMQNFNEGITNKTTTNKTSNSINENDELLSKFKSIDKTTENELLRKLLYVNGVYFLSNREKYNKKTNVHADMNVTINENCMNKFQINNIKTLISNLFKKIPYNILNHLDITLLSHFNIKSDKFINSLLNDQLFDVYEPKSMIHSPIKLDKINKASEKYQNFVNLNNKNSKNKEKLSSSFKIIDIYLKDQTAYVLDKSGNLFGWGLNSKCQIGDTNRKSHTEPIRINNEHKLLRDQKLKTITSNKFGTIIACSEINNSNEEFVRELEKIENKKNSGKIDYQDAKLKIRKLKSHYENINNGVVIGRNCYAWGSNKNGLLGNGNPNEMHVQCQAQLLKNSGSLFNSIIRKVELNENYATVLTYDGNLHFWGTNHNAQFGISNKYIDYRQLERGVINNVNYIYNSMKTNNINSKYSSRKNLNLNNDKDLSSAIKSNEESTSTSLNKYKKNDDDDDDIVNNDKDLYPNSFKLKNDKNKHTDNNKKKLKLKNKDPLITSSHSNKMNPNNKELIQKYNQVKFNKIKGVNENYVQKDNRNKNDEDELTKAVSENNNLNDNTILQAENFINDDNYYYVKPIKNDFSFSKIGKSAFITHFIQKQNTILLKTLAGDVYLLGSYYNLRIKNDNIDENSNEEKNIFDTQLMKKLIQNSFINKIFSESVLSKLKYKPYHLIIKDYSEIEMQLTIDVSWNCHHMEKTDLNVCGNTNTNADNSICVAPDQCICRKQSVLAGIHTINETFINNNKMIYKTISNYLESKDNPIYTNELKNKNNINLKLENEMKILNDLQTFIDQGDNVFYINTEIQNSGKNCDQYTCFGKSSKSPKVCTNGRGTCTSTNHCKCKIGYYGEECQYYNCFDVESRDPSSCSSPKNGRCESPNHCLCNNGYYGKKCEFYKCFGYAYNDIQYVCSGYSKGECVAPNTCKCKNGYYGKKCEQFDCFNINSKQKNLVCSKGNGACVSPDKCKCVPGFTGKDCSIIEKTNPLKESKINEQDSNLSTHDIINNENENNNDKPQKSEEDKDYSDSFIEKNDENVLDESEKIEKPLPQSSPEPEHQVVDQKNTTHHNNNSTKNYSSINSNSPNTIKTRILALIIVVSIICLFYLSLSCFMVIHTMGLIFQHLKNYSHFDFTDNSIYFSVKMLQALRIAIVSTILLFFSVTIIPIFLSLLLIGELIDICLMIGGCFRNFKRVRDYTTNFYSKNNSLYQSNCFGSKSFNRLVDIELEIIRRII
jgi:hypothetical protein